MKSLKREKVVVHTAKPWYLLVAAELGVHQILP